MSGARGDMSQDAVIEAIDQVVVAAARLHQAVDRVTHALTGAQDMRRNGEHLNAIVEQLLSAGGRDLRLQPTAASADFERAVTVYRTAAIREFVDVEAMTFTQVAALIGVSRQMVARLYRAEPWPHGWSPRGDA